MTTRGSEPAHVGRAALARRPDVSFSCRLCATLLVALAATLPGCETPQAKPQAVAPPPPAFLGASYLHGTVGSMVRLQGADPLLVSGYGVVVNLNGTGSAEVPAYLRQWLVNEMLRKGLNSPRLGTTNLTPAAVLASEDTAVVAVQGLIPPGAARGSRFDVLVTALPDTQTTSLEGGQLWTADVSIDGLNPSMQFSQPLGSARGATFLNPLAIGDPEAVQAERDKLPRTAVVLGGGVVTESRRIELYLNQRSWLRCRAIADRINERFPKGAKDRAPTADPQNDVIVRINIPSVYHEHEDEFLNLISHLFIERGPGFAENKAQQLAEELMKDPKLATQIVYTWQALGKTVLPLLRSYYEHPDMNLRLAALDAGTRLEDGAPTENLLRLSAHPDANVRARCAELIARLPRSPRVGNAIKALLDDEAPTASGQPVRIVTYEAIAGGTTWGNSGSIDSSLVQRVPIGDPTDFKFLIDLLPSNKPMVYIRQVGVPRLVIFQRHAGFKAPLTASLWDGHLRLRATDPQEPIAVFYQRSTGAGKQFTMAPTVANLALLLAQPASIEHPNESPNLSYSHVVSALYELHRAGYLNADFRMQTNELATAVERSLRAPRERPETSPKSRGYEALVAPPDAAGTAAATNTTERPATTVATLPTERPATAAGSADTRPVIAAAPARTNPATTVAPSPEPAVDPNDLPPAEETYLIPAPGTGTPGSAPAP